MPSVAVVVVSCDKYADLWVPYFHLLDRYWQERPGPVYLVTNEKEPQFPGVRTLAVGSDESWSDTLGKALDRIGEEYVLLCLEDLLLCGPVDVHRLGLVLQWVGDARPDHVRLNPSEPPYAPFSDLVGLVPPGAPYRTTTVLSLWRKEVLTQLLRPGENAWQFEMEGTVRSDRFDRFFSVHRRIFPVVNGVIRGKWQRNGLRHVTALGAPVDPAARQVMTISESLRYEFGVFRARVFKALPWQWRRSFRALVG